MTAAPLPSPLTTTAPLPQGFAFCPGCYCTECGAGTYELSSHDIQVGLGGELKCTCGEPLLSRPLWGTVCRRCRERTAKR